MDLITNSLYWLSTGLLVPVIVLLLIFFVRSLLLGGSFYGQFIKRNKEFNKLTELLKEHEPDKLPLNDFSDKQRETDGLIKTISDLSIKDNSLPKLEKLIGDYEILADKELSKSRTLTKLGPMLGLMGTLIPMGPALVGLATGDVASMASNMQVAFATTVIGIFVGAVGFITLQVKQRWYADDMNTLEFIAASITENKTKNN